MWKSCMQQDTARRTSAGSDGKNRKTRQETAADYRVYRFNQREWAICLGELLGLGALISYLFYHSPFALVLLLPFGPYWIRRKQREKAEKRRERLRYEFKECLQAVSGALNAGYSMENAWKDAEKDMVRFLGEESDMTRELKRMNRQIALNTPIEKLLSDFAFRSGLEDVQSFCQVFQFAKRGGGDLTEIIRNTSLRIGDKAELEREIETAMSAKRMEQKIMSVMPLFILLYIGLTSPDFLGVLYGNLLGVAVMTACLTAYGGSVLLARKIVSIKI